MFGKEKKEATVLKPQLFTVRWYPSSRSFGGTRRIKSRPNVIPPLMVRKAEWRR